LLAALRLADGPDTQPALFVTDADGTSKRGGVTSTGDALTQPSMA
jgi:hypothetical protein